MTVLTCSGRVVLPGLSCGGRLMRDSLSSTIASRFEADELMGSISTAYSTTSHLPCCEDVVSLPPLPTTKKTAPARECRKRDKKREPKPRKKNKCSAKEIFPTILPPLKHTP
eukprot:TRINITY_DN31552_c0_g1_i1.p1 TRINITY_DN31552_c0_g1~~TRINITY_DN31552_c0_g1_i1.p1  ORF type:complete len:112 (+),score=0.51 TRINITY_DN31552_c0_g1_i1:116-451(+)